MSEPSFVNRTVWTGGNLDVLRGINSECVDLIYLISSHGRPPDGVAHRATQRGGAEMKDETDGYLDLLRKVAERDGIDALIVGMQGALNATAKTLADLCFISGWGQDIEIRLERVLRADTPLDQLLMNTRNERSDAVLRASERAMRRTIVRNIRTLREVTEETKERG